MLTQNICYKRNLSNGTEVTYPSLILDQQEDLRHLLNRIENAKAGEDIYLRYPPQYINVSVDGRDVKEFNGLSLVENRAVIPIGRSFKGNRIKTYVTENTTMAEINSVCHGVDIRFAITMHKVEGKTIHRLCADLNDHAFQTHIDFHGLFVTISRAKTMKHFARLPYQPEPFNLQHLRNLKPPRNLVTWLNSYKKKRLFQQRTVTQATDPRKQADDKKKKRRKSRDRDEGNSGEKEKKMSNDVQHFIFFFINLFSHLLWIIKLVGNLQPFMKIYYWQKNYRTLHC